jgi:hypothetical protein
MTATAGFAAGADGEQTMAAIGAAAAPALAADVDWSLPGMHVSRGVDSRGALLPTLYGSLAALNAFDAFTTSKAIRSGSGVEANPLMQGVASNGAALWAVKGGVTAGSILLADRMWRNHNRVGAIATMIVSNAVMSAVAVNNARVAGAR